MRAEKRALEAAGYSLAYSRKSDQSGYYLRERSPLHADLARVLDGSVVEVDPDQIGIYRQLGPAVFARDLPSVTPPGKWLFIVCDRGGPI